MPDRAPILPALRPACGFTLFELLMVMIVAAIFTAMAVPNLQNFLVVQRINSAAAEFLQALNLTRSTAIMRGAPAHMAPLVNNDWRSGWRIFIKHDSNNGRDFEAQDILIAEHGPLPPALAVASTTTPLIIVYQANGTGPRGSWLISQDQLPHRQLISSNFLGRSRGCLIGTWGCALTPGLIKKQQ